MSKHVRLCTGVFITLIYMMMLAACGEPPDDDMTEQMQQLEDAYDSPESVGY